MATSQLRIRYHGVTLMTFGLWHLQGLLDGREVIPVRRFSTSYDGAVEVAPGRHTLELVALGPRRRTRNVTIDLADAPGQVLEVGFSWAWGWLAKPRVAVVRAG